jgi:pyrroloquinoline-quinone synthase
MIQEAWNSEEFLEHLRKVGTQSYHHLHPFHVRMNAGDLDQDSIRLWVANRFYYQCNIPRKDAAILANCPLREVRQKWIKRISDHDGSEGKEGGIEKWIRLGIACGLASEAMIDERHVRPGVRFALDAYVNFARTQPWPIAIASSLTELFAPDLIDQLSQTVSHGHDGFGSTQLCFEATRILRPARFLVRSTPQTRCS